MKIEKLNLTTVMGQWIAFDKNKFARAAGTLEEIFLWVDSHNRQNTGIKRIKLEY